MTTVLFQRAGWSQVRTGGVPDGNVHHPAAYLLHVPDRYERVVYLTVTYEQGVYLTVTCTMLLLTCSCVIYAMFDQE